MIMPDSLKSWIVIPIKTLEQGKSRLRGTLTDDKRQQLIIAMLRHVVGVADGVAGSHLLILGPTRHGLPDRIRLLPDPGTGLNAAIQGAIAIALAEQVDRLAIILADLPCLTKNDVEALFAVDKTAIAVASDEGGTGTNALSIPLPQGSGFRASFGAYSLQAHQAEAQRLGLPVQHIRSAGLGFDIDRPADYDRFVSNGEVE